MNDIDAKATAVMERIHVRVANALRCSRDERKPEIIRAIAAAYIELHRNRKEYLHAAFQNDNVRLWVEDETPRLMKFDLVEFIIHVPAVWEFEFTEVIGDVSDALWCAGQYGTTKGGKAKWVRFVRVKPMRPTDPFNAARIPIVHKENSRFRQGWENRNRLKHALGSQYRKLVNDARGMTKKEFLNEFHKQPIPFEKQEVTIITHRSGRTLECRTTGKLVKHIEPQKLLNLTGYTPEEFWREVDYLKRNNGNHVEPKKPQLELLPA